MSVAAVLSATTVTIAMQSSSSPARVVTSPTGPPALCEAASVPVPVRVGEKVTFTFVPPGFSMMAGDPSDPTDYPILYEGPSPFSYPVSYVPPSLTLLQNPASPSTAASVTHVEVGGVPATLEPMPLGSGGWTVSWSPAPGMVLVLDATGISRSEVLAVVTGMRVDPGTLKDLPATPRTEVSAARAKQALHLDAVGAVHTALTSWFEIERLADPQNAPKVAADYRPTWLVYATDQKGLTSWAAVDANNGAVLDQATAKNTGWVTAITDRSRPGCEPPLGILTPSELAEAAFGAPGVPMGYTLALTSRSVADALLRGEPCKVSCSDPLAWIAYTGTPVTAESFDATTGQEEAASVGGNTSLGPTLGVGLLPGPTPLSLAASPPNPPMPASPVLPQPPDPTSKQPAPAGNGNGPEGQCNGSEKVPPCGPGAVVGQAYPYTLPLLCSGDVTFDGRMWRQTLLPPSNLAPIRVWITLQGQSGAGWSSPDGGVGLEPLPSGPAPNCG